MLNIEGARQLVEVLGHDIHSLNDGAYCCAAYCLSSIAHQPDVKAGLLRRLIPHYRSETRRLNQLRSTHFEQVVADNETLGDDRPVTYEKLRLFSAMLKESHCYGVLCLMPVSSKQTVDHKLIETIESDGMTFLDLRKLVSQTTGHYRDGWHTDAVAAEIYSRAVADALAERFPGLKFGMHSK